MLDLEIENILRNSEMCGYNFEELLIFAEACRKAGITENNLHDFCMNCESAFNYIHQKFMEKIESEILGEQ